LALFLTSDGGQLFRDAATISSGSPDQISNSDSRAASESGGAPSSAAGASSSAGAAGLTLTSSPSLSRRGGLGTVSLLEPPQMNQPRAILPACEARTRYRAPRLSCAATPA
jgi:hypothetical protein